MSKERDFSTVTFKVNTSGSWANLVTCDVQHYDEVKEACEFLAKVGSAKFKIVDEAGGEIEMYSYAQRGGWAWRAPKR